jgi:hypothetical protein
MSAMRRKYARLTKQVGISMEPDLYKELYNRCLIENISMSELIRIMVLDFIKRNPLFNTTPDAAEGPTKITPGSPR